AGGEPELVAGQLRLGGVTAPRCIGWPRLLDDGRSAFVIDWDGSALGDTSLLTLGTNDLHPLVSSGSAGAEAPTGHLLYTQADNIMFAAAVDRATGRLAGPATAVIRDVALDGAGGAFAVSDTGTLVYARGQLRGSPFELKRLVRLDAAGRPEAIIFPPSPFQIPPNLSRDGRYLVVSSRTHGLWIGDLERGTRARLPIGRTRLARFPVWSPDSERVFFRGAWLGEMGWKLFVQSSDGSSDPELLFGDDAIEKRPRGVSPDGATLFCEILGGEADRGLWEFPLSGSGARRRVFAGTITEADISPDGRWLAYQSEEFGSREVFVRRTVERARSLQISIAGGCSPRWSLDGEELFYFAGDRLLAAPINGSTGEAVLGPARPVLECPNIEGFAVGAGGAIIGVERQPDSALVRQLQLVTGWLSELRALAPLA
ncbi:MAG: TolB family protein, partial [Vicinamibacterales bacterium]